MKNIVRHIPKIKESFFLFGPRGTGKSTWLTMSYPDALIIDLLSTSTFRTITANPERLIELVEGNPDKNTFIIDEVQKVPLILSVVHKLIEEKKDKQFILTGSSARKLKRTGVDLLAGRALLKKCHPFMASELKNLFNLSEALKIGLVPLIVASENPAGVLDTYIGLYLREEVQAEGLVRNINNFSRFLEAISFSYGSVLNISEVARECEVERKTVEGYISILEDLLISYSLPVFSKRAKRKMVKHSKFYYFDCGVFNAIRPKGPLDNRQGMYGISLEGLVLQNLLAWKDYSDFVCNIYYWRTHSGSEVDFVIYGENIFYGIEVKSSATIHPKDLSGLKSFHEDYPEATLLLLYMSKEILKKGKIICIPVETFLINLIPNQPLWKTNK
ncbi:MAG: ATP-binding protein [Bacteroidales bacterium]|nr:ATP-binding protein [Bacteroidales bacterium]